MAKYVRAEPFSIRPWLIALGVLPLLIAVGFAMTGFINFKFGIIIMIVCTLLLAADFWYISKSIQLVKRICVEGIIFFVLSLILWFIFVSAPLSVLIDAPPGNYPKGEDILGIQWTGEYSPVIITLINDTDIEYNNFDSYVRTDNKFIAHVGVYGGINNCIATPENTSLLIFNPTLSDDKKEISVPLFQENKQFPASIYRIRCDRISMRSHVNVVLAVIGPTNPTWTIGSFQYAAANRSRGPLFFSKCLSGPCSNIPTKFIGGHN
jgi:hypothetical protein